MIVLRHSSAQPNLWQVIMTEKVGQSPSGSPGQDRLAADSLAAEHSAEERPSRWVESGLLLKIALPLAAAYLAELAMFITTKLVVGELGYRELAATGLAGGLAFEPLLVLMGLLSIVGVLVAQAEGAGRKRDAGNAARQGLLVATGLGLLGTVLVWNLDLVLTWTGQDPVIIALAEPYLHTLSGFVLPTLYFSVLRSFVAALAKTGAVMVITVSAVGLNYLLTYGLVHGAFGLPAMGLAGAGLATTIVAWVMFLSIGLYIYRTETLRGYGLFKGRLHLDLPVCGEILRLGLPVAGLVALEAGLFIGVSILSGVIGVTPLAAYEILISWLGVPFVVALGLAEATMVRVAFASGRGAPLAARQAGLIGMVMGVGILVIMMIIPLSVPHLIAQVFLEKGSEGFDAVSSLVAELLIIVVFFQVFDGLQAIAARALRGIRDTLAPLWIAGFGYWILGIGGGSLLTFPLGYGVKGLWWGLAAGLSVTGSLLAWRFWKLTNRRS